jgi:hypothetical protein
LHSDELADVEAFRPAADLWVGQVHKHPGDNDSRLHLGLGEATVVDIEIRWPSGSVEKLAKTPADQLIYVTEGSGITRAQKFAQR